MIAAAWLGLDQLTKLWAVAELRGAAPVDVIPGFFRLVYHTNPGAAFGLLNHAPHVLPFLTLGLLAWLAWLARSLDWAKPGVRVGCALVAGGAAGNLVDRARLGQVIDFLDFWFWGWNYPTFNFADTGICVGVGLLLLSEWRRKENDDRVAA